MPVSSELEKQLKVAAKTGKYLVGRKEVLASLKGSKLLVWSASANIPDELLNQCKTLQIPALRYDGDPIALGKTCGIPFKVSVIAIRSAGDADLNPFAASQDYAVPRSGLLTQMTVPRVHSEIPEGSAKEPKEVKEPKKAESKESVEKEEAPKKKAKLSKSSREKKPKAKKTKE